MVEVIQKVAGRLKAMDFARNLLNLLHENKGSMNLGRKQLSELLGDTNPNRIQKYRQVIIKAGLLHLGTA